MIGEDEVTCPFCNPGPEDVLLRNDLAYARWDAFPTTEGHMLILPYRHVRTYFDATAEEMACILQLIDEGRDMLEQLFCPDGYNIGVNVGGAAGQRVAHLHVHLIPRRAGDVAEAPDRNWGKHQWPPVL